MPIEQIVQQLRAERDRLDAAIKALTGVSGAAPARPSGGRKKTMSAAAEHRELNPLAIRRERTD